MGHPEQPVLIWGKISDSVARGVRIDGPTHTVPTIGYIHHEIHNGNGYKFDINTADLDSEGDNNALHIKIVTPNTAVWGHLTYIVWASGAAEFSLTEAPSGGASGGDAGTAINRHRNSNNSSVMTITTDDTAPTGGTEIHHEKLGSGKNKVASSGEDREEFILKQNATYSFRMTSETNAISAQMTLNWYELQSKN